MTKEFPGPDGREWAKLLYTEKDYTNSDIALIVGVQEAKVRQWISEGAWHGQKRSLLTSKTNLLQHYQDQLEKLRSDFKDNDKPDVKNLDAYVKYCAAIKNLEAEPSPSAIIEISVLFLNWLRRKDLDLTKKLVVLFDAFIKQRLAA